MVSLQSALLPEARRPRAPCLSLVDAVAVVSTATSKKRKRGGGDEDGDGGEVGIELGFDAAPLPLEWQRCLDIKSGQIHYYNTRTHKRTSRDPRAEAPAPALELHNHRAAPAEEEEAANYCAPPPGLDLDLNLTFEPRRVPVQETKKHRPAAETTKPTALLEEKVALELLAGGASREMVAAVCTRCYMLVMMCREWPACPNCKFVHPTTNHSSPPPPPKPAPLKLGLQLLCCRD